MSTVKREKTPQQALATLMRLASKAEKSSGDARRLMYGWGVGKADQAAILERLTAQKFIDDERFAAAYVREKVRFSGWGAYKIRAALSAKGIAREIVDRAVECLDDREMDDRLEKHLRRKLPSIKADSAYQMRSKLMRYGISLGYGYEEVGAAVDKLGIRN